MTIPWLLYKHYEDSTILEEFYNASIAYVEYYRGVYKKTGLQNFPFRSADWQPPEPYEQTNKHLSASYAFLHDVNLLINISQVLGKQQDVVVYTTLYEQLAEEFHRVFFRSSSNYYGDGMQAAQVFALALPKVVPENLRQTVINYLVEDINKKKCSCHNRNYINCSNLSCFI